jgi:hypothetical protein
MSERVRPLARLAALAEDQWGLFTTRQAAQAGVPWPSLARMAVDGRVERVASGVYRVRGGAQPDHLELRAAWLQLDPATSGWERIAQPEVALVSHRSAAALFGVGDLPTDIYEFTLPMRRQTRRVDVRLHRAPAVSSDRVILNGLPVTRPGRMISDLLAARVEPAAVAHIAREILERGYEYPDVVSKYVAPYAARYGLSRHNGEDMIDYLLLLAGVADSKRWMETVIPSAGVR